MGYLTHLESPYLHAEVRFLEVAIALAIREFEQRRPKLTSRRRLILGHVCIFMKASRVVLRGVRLREEP